MMLSLGFVLGTYAMVMELVPILRALDETSYTLVQGGDGELTSGSGTDVVISASAVSLGKDDNWFDMGWNLKRQLTIKNLSAITLPSNTPIQLTLNTKELFDASNIQNDCDDLRVIYSTGVGNHTELARSYYKASGATDCSDSTATVVTFPIQAELTAGATSSNYYLYYKNSGATNPGFGDNGYNIGDAEATMVCPFNGSTTCVDGETPSTATGALRFSGGSAIETDGAWDNPDKITGPTLPSVSQYTIEFFVKNNGNFNSYAGIYGGWGGFDANDINTGGSVNGMLLNPGSLGLIGLTVNHSSGQWVHLAFVYDGVNYSVYENGNRIYYTPKTFSISAQGFYLGARNSYRGFKGLYDEFRISNIARYSGSFTTPTSNFTADANTLVLYHFDENGDDLRNTGKAYDSSGNGYHGTISGAKYTSNTLGIYQGTATPIKTQNIFTHEGVLLEEGATNLITNPSFENTTYNLNWGNSFFNYNNTLDTFTASITKRNSAGPFTSGVILQDDYGDTSSLTSDQLSFSHGTTLWGDFSNSSDDDQGTLVFWWTPEYSSSTMNTGSTMFMEMRSSSNFTYNWVDDKFYLGGSPIGTYDFSAGQTYLVVLRWDKDNNIIANTANLSIDNVSIGDASSSGHVWEDDWGSTNLWAFDGVVEGMTVYRRPLFDGLYGIDMGTGDEIEQIYNAGAGKDPTLITGSWDVVFAMPTNSDNGVITTGTGNAWSHPHQLNLLYTNSTNTGGYMLNGDYSIDNWTGIASPQSISALSTVEKIYSGGYKIESNLINQGISRSFAASSGGDYVIRAIGNSDGTCTPVVKILRADGITEITSKVGTSLSTKSSPEVYIFTWESPALEDNIIQLLNTNSSGICYWHQAEVYNNLFNNPSLESGAGDPWIPTSWWNANIPVGGTQQETTIVHSGQSSIKHNLNSLNTSIGTNLNTNPPTGSYFVVGGHFYGVPNGNGKNQLSAHNYSDLQHQPLQRQLLGLKIAEWHHTVGVYRKAQGSNTIWGVGLIEGTGVHPVYSDDLYAISLSDVSLNVSPASEVNSTETTGIRVDGRDVLSQPITGLSADKGLVKFKFTPRHSFSIADKFGVANPVIVTLTYDGNSYIKIQKQDPTTLRMIVKFNDSQSLNLDWNNAILNAGTSYDFEIRYYSGGTISLSVNGEVKAIASGATNFANVPNTAYFGSDGGANVYDSTINSFVSLTPTENLTQSNLKFGTRSLKLVNSGASPDEYVTDFTSTTNAAHTVSAYIFNATSGDIGEAVSTSVAQIILDGELQTTQYEDAGGGWWRLLSRINKIYGDYPTTNMDSDQGLFTGTSNRLLSQSIKPTQNLQTVQVVIPLKKVGAGTPTTTHYQVRINTDIGGAPSGTLPPGGHSSCIAVTTSTSYQNISFTIQTSLAANTTYHLVLTPYVNSNCSTLQTTADPTNYIAWGYDGSTSSYLPGERSIYDGSTWTQQTSKDHIFTLYTGRTMVVGLRVMPGKSVYMDGVQVVSSTSLSNPLPHTYTDGSLGAGYGWTGEEHNSTSTRTRDSLYYPVQDSFGPTSGTVSFWFKPYRPFGSGYDQSAQHWIYSSHTTQGSQSSVSAYVDSGRNLNFRLANDANQVFDISQGPWSAGIFQVQKWHNMVLVWDGTKFSAYINNVLYGEINYTGTLTINNANMGIGSTSGWAPAFGTISDFRIYNNSLDVNEVGYLYQSGLSTHTQSDIDDKKYKTTADYESGVLDLGNAGQWGNSPNLLITEALNGNTINYQTRSSEDNLVWSDYAAVSGDTPNLTISSPPKRYLQVKATLNSPNQNTTPEFNGAQINYVQDAIPPEVNATETTMKRTVSGDTIIENNFSNSQAPYFSWVEGGDDADGSGLRGYCLYLGPDIAGNPANDKGLLGSSPGSTANTTCPFVVTTNSIDFANTNLRGNTWLQSTTDPYYIVIRAVDNTGNVYDLEPEIFGFKFDNTPPTNPSGLFAPASYQRSFDSFVISWPADGTNMAQDTHSLVKGFQYKLGTNGTWYGGGHTGDQDCNDVLTTNTYALDANFDNLPSGETPFYLRTLDYACNTSASAISAILKYNSTAPSAPRDLSVTPVTNDKNEFSFTWLTPEIYQGAESNLSYCYTVNTLPTSGTCIFTSSKSLNPDAFATQPGENTFYVVSRDEASNINYGDYASIKFYANTSAPGVPRNLDVADISVKTTKNWRLTVSWDEPEDLGAGVAKYFIYRSFAENANCSENFSLFGKVGETAGGSYVDTNLQQKDHFYCVRACDSTNNCSAVSSTGSNFPDGKFTSPAILESAPVVSSVSTRSARISWITDRDSDSRISYGLASNDYFKEEVGNSEQRIDHDLILTNLEPGTTYYFQAKWTDEDGNLGLSDEYTFKTAPPPSVKDVVVSSVGISTAVINFTTTGSSKVNFLYGTSVSFGSSKEIATSPLESRYTTLLDGLSEGSKYYFRVDTEDDEGYVYEGTVLDFNTLPQPKLSNVRIQQVKNAAQPTVLVSWESNTEVTSVVSLFPEGKADLIREEVNLDLKGGEHQMIIRGLLPNTVYELLVKGSDKLGNQATSTAQRITTATDTRPPAISNVQIEAGKGNVTDSSQFIVTWTTDEPTTSQVEYGEGTGSSYPQRSQLDSNFTLDHTIVISGLAPGKVYHLRAVSTDDAENTTYSLDYVAITPKESNSAIELVISSLSRVFSFLR
ncbi:MAG TPA: fibronectin type III domain-containing protein [Candidatus Dojkabacteria bacterium]|nr:fibronectin type III domain-containing protein [Candidatus Dojkabacteria bacterium]HRP51762.1 fibronectin type III domain-containing protein [Candidatus Dojkabacteria bacterium]